MAVFRLARWFLITAALAWLAWFVFTGEPSFGESLAGVVCALFCAWFCNSRLARNGFADCLAHNGFS
jgi:multisubunit Na+/H+ antiporter MnhE subunit